MRRQLDHNPPSGILKQPANSKPHQICTRATRPSLKLGELATVLLGQ
jgi:hypothetical protein